MSRPEHQGPPELVYNNEEAEKYTTNSHIIEVQTRLAERALQLLELPDNEHSVLLDIGCGSGLSGAVLTKAGHDWLGVDISPAMLHVASKNEDCQLGNLLLADMGSLLRFRPGSFDGAISISAIQWLCNADKTSHHPYRRLLTFFGWLFNALTKGARAVLQFYPENDKQLEMITSAATRSGFNGGTVIDNPEATRAKKYFLVISAGGNVVPSAITPSGNVVEDDSEHVKVGTRQVRTRRGRTRTPIKDRDWVLRKKEALRSKGKEVHPDTKYTARKRKNRF